MIGRGISLALLAACLLLSACGNKGPLVPAAEADQQKQKQQKADGTVE